MIEESVAMNIIQIPTKKGNLKKVAIIGIIDSSGSMREYWPWVSQYWNKVEKGNICFTFTFDTKVREVKDNTLNGDLKLHGGGGTKVPEVFMAFEQKLNEIPKDHAVTVLFISDGQDNYQEKLEERLSRLNNNHHHYLNFICLGIKSEFPTFLAMRLRQLYHRGDPNVPAVYLVEYPSEKAFFNKFETMKQYFSARNTVNVKPSVQIYPWSEPQTSVLESSWVRII
jgi:hypothetical protein